MAGQAVAGCCPGGNVKKYVLTLLVSFALQGFAAEQSEKV